MGLRDRKVQASETSKATKKIGLVAKIVVEAGVAPFGRGITNVIKNESFRPYSDESESETREKVQEATEKATKNFPITNFQVGPVLSVRVIKDTNLTSSRWKGNMYNMKDYDPNDRFTHKRHSDFILDHMSDEINDLEGKEFWAHVAWKNLPAVDKYGGDYNQINVDNNDELSIIITHLANKRAAVDLVKSLREGTTTIDDLCRARGYDVDGVRKAIGEALGKTNENKDQKSLLSGLGSKTKQYYNSMDKFVSNVEFLQENLKKFDNDIDAMAEKCLAEPGDVAILLNQPKYFRDKMEDTGLGEQEALVKIAKDTGLADAKDLAAFLGITEPAF